MQAAVDDAVDEDNFRSGPVFISGASGDSAADMNGYYGPTLGFGMDGRVVYAKYGGGGVCIEHFGGRGESACMASGAGGCALVDCLARVWARTSTNGPTKDMRMKLLTGDDAEQEVSGCCMAHNEALAADALARACVLLRAATVCDDTRRASPIRRRSTHHSRFDEWIHVRARWCAHERVLPAHQGEAGGTSGVREGERWKHVPGVLAGQMAHQAV